MTPRLLFVHALSPLHAGTGQSTGAVELPVARDRATGLPLLPGSSLKGALRDRAVREAKPEIVAAVFGPDTAHASDHAGALLVGDANLLLLPVRSAAGTFAWATSPYVLERFARDAREAGASPPAVPPVASVDRCLVTGASALRIGERVVFEDLDFSAAVDPGADAIARFVGERLFAGQAPWIDLLRRRLCVVHDDAMSFLATHATDVVARVALEHDTKTVKDGALWHEESLPTETVLVSLVAEASNGRANDGDVERLLRQVCEQPIQLGGKATVGRGRCRLVVAGGGAR